MHTHSRRRVFLLNMRSCIPPAEQPNKNTHITSHERDTLMNFLHRRRQRIRTCPTSLRSVRSHIRRQRQPCGLSDLSSCHYINHTHMCAVQSAHMTTNVMVSGILYHGCICMCDRASSPISLIKAALAHPVCERSLDQVFNNFPVVAVMHRFEVRAHSAFAY